MSDPMFNAAARLASIGITTPEQVLEKAVAEKKNLVAVALIWRSATTSGTGYSGWELFRHDHVTGNAVTDRRTNGNRFFFAPERDDAIEYTMKRYGLDKLDPISGFQRCLFPHWVRLRVLAWLRKIPKELSTQEEVLTP